MNFSKEGTRLWYITFAFLVTLASYFITINDKLQFGVTTIVFFAPYLLEVLEIMNQNKNGYLIYDLIDHHTQGEKYDLEISNK